MSRRDGAAASEAAAEDETRLQRAVRVGHALKTSESAAGAYCFTSDSKGFRHSMAADVGAGEAREEFNRRMAKLREKYQNLRTAQKSAKRLEEAKELIARLQAALLEMINALEAQRDAAAAAERDAAAAAAATAEEEQRNAALLARDIAITREQLAEALVTVLEAQALLNERNFQLILLTGEVKALEAENAVLMESDRVAKAEIEGLLGWIQKLNDENLKRREVALQLAKELGDATGRLKQTEAELTDANSKLAREIEETEAARKDLDAKVKRLEEAAEAQKRAFELLEAEKSDCDEERKKLEECEEALMQARRALVAMQLQNRILKKQIEDVPDLEPVTPPAGGGGGGTFQVDGQDIMNKREQFYNACARFDVEAVREFLELGDRMIEAYTSNRFDIPETLQTAGGFDLFDLSDTDRAVFKTIEHPFNPMKPLGARNLGLNDLFWEHLSLHPWEEVRRNGDSSLIRKLTVNYAVPPILCLITNTSFKGMIEFEREDFNEEPQVLRPLYHTEELMDALKAKAKPFQEALESAQRMVFDAKETRIRKILQMFAARGFKVGYEFEKLPKLYHDDSIGFEAELYKFLPTSYVSCYFLRKIDLHALPFAVEEMIRVGILNNDPIMCQFTVGYNDKRMQRRPVFLTGKRVAPDPSPGGFKFMEDVQVIETTPGISILDFLLCPAVFYQHRKAATLASATDYYSILRMMMMNHGFRDSNIVKRLQNIEDEEIYLPQGPFGAERKIFSVVDGSLLPPRGGTWYDAAAPIIAFYNENAQ